MTSAKHIGLYLKTRMHSSRMHTGRPLTVFWRLLLRGGYLVPGGVPGPGGGSWGVYLVLGWGGVYLVPGGVPGPGVPGPGGVYLVLGGVPGPRGGGCTWSQGGYLVWGVYLVPGGVPGPGGRGEGGCLVRYSPCEQNE